MRAEAARTFLLSLKLYNRASELLKKSTQAKSFSDRFKYYFHGELQFLRARWAARKGNRLVRRAERQYIAYQRKLTELGIAQEDFHPLC